MARSIKEGDLMRLKTFCIITTTAVLSCVMSKSMKCKVNANCSKAEPMGWNKCGLRGGHKFLTLNKKRFESLAKGKKPAEVNANNSLISLHFQWSFDFGDRIKPR